MTSDNTPPDAEGAGIWGNIGVWSAFGALVGVVVGSFFDNVGLGVALGLPAGVAAWAVFTAVRNARREP